MRRLVALSTCAIVACASFAQPADPPAAPAEQQAYGRAISVLVDDPAGSEAQLEKFLGRWPDSPLADDAVMRLGELARDRGDFDTALLRFEDVVRDYPRSERADPARVEIARIESGRGRASNAAAVMGQVRLSRLAPRERQRAYRVLADVAPDPVARLRWLARLRAELEDPNAIAAVDDELDQLIGMLDPPDLERAAHQLARGIPAARVWLRAADLALDVGDVDAAERALEKAQDRPLVSAYQPRQTAVENRLRVSGDADVREVSLPSFSQMKGVMPPDTSSAVGTLGVALPLSGRFARFGEESLQGVLLAAGIFGNESGRGPRMRVLIRDTAGRPERAAAAVRELARDERVTAIVGPLLSGESEAAATEAEKFGVPLLTLTARVEVPQGRPHVFRLRTMPREEVATLVAHAVENLEARRFAILYPRDAYGRGLRALFWEMVEQRGGEVVAVAGYDPEAVDFADSIRRLVGYVLLSNEEKELIKERENMRKRARRLPPEEALELRLEASELTGPNEMPLPPIVDFDAHFIPESHENVLLIQPKLAFNEASGNHLLGPNR